MNKYTATNKNRACTRKAATADKVKELNSRMVDKCDRAIERDNRAQEQRDRRAAYKAARSNKGVAA